MALLTLSVAPSVGKTFNLSLLGSADWWGYTSSKTVVRKSGGGGKIQVAHVGSFTDDIANDSNVTTKWTDGDVVASTTGVTSLLFGTGNGNGYNVSVPADTSQRTLYICAGVYSATMTVTATLTDGTGGTKTATATWVSGGGLQSMFVINFAAASANQTLNVSVTQGTIQGSYSNCGIQAIALTKPTTIGGHNLTMTGATYDQNGKFGPGLSGGSGLVTGMLASHQLTIAGHVKTSVTPSATQVAFGQGAVAWVGMDVNGYALATWGGDGDQTMSTTTKINDGAQHYLELCVDAILGGYFFVDGVLVKTVTGISALDFNNADNRFGVAIFPYGPPGGGSLGYNLVGEVSNVSVYNTVRHTAAYTAPTAATSTTDPGLIALYTFNGNGNDTAGVTGASAPNSPTIGTATAGTNSVTAAFTPSSTGTTATSFTAVWSGGGTATGTSSPLTITGLTAGTAGTVHVYASAGGLNSANSAESGSVTPTAAASGVTIPFTDSAIFWSPYNWDTLGTYKQSNNAGAYCKFGFTGTSLTVNFDVSALSSSGLSASSWPIVRAVVDGTVAYDQQLTSSGVINLPTMSAGSHTFELHYLATDDNNGDQWVTPVQAVRIKSFVIATGATYSAPTVRTKRHLHFGDSISRGYMANGTNLIQPASNNSQLTVPPSLAKMFGAELGVVAFSGQGYEQTGNGGVVPVLTAWNQYSSGRSRLSSNLLSPAPDYITIEHGTNGTTTSSDVQQLLVALRAAAPSAKIIQMSPRGGFARAAVAAGVNAVNDANVFLVDLGTDYQTGIANYTGTPNMFSVDGLHPNPLANMRAAAGFAGAIQAALSSSGSTPLANAVYLSNGRLKRSATGSTAPTGKRLTVK